LICARKTKLPDVRQKYGFVLPARLARLSRAIAVILVRESTALPASAALVAATVATPVSATVAVEPAAATAASRTTGCGLGASFVHLEIAPPDFFSIETCYGLGCFCIVGHFNKCKSARPAGLAIGRDVDARYLPERLKQRPQIRLGRLKTHVADE
jgi:hypothetical protein